MWVKITPLPNCYCCSFRVLRLVFQTMDPNIMTVPCFPSVFAVLTWFSPPFLVHLLHALTVSPESPRFYCCFMFVLPVLVLLPKCLPGQCILQCFNTLPFNPLHTCVLRRDHSVILQTFPRSALSSAKNRLTKAYGDSRFNLALIRTTSVPIRRS